MDRLWVNNSEIFLVAQVTYISTAKIIDKKSVFLGHPNEYNLLLPTRMRMFNSKQYD